MEGREGCSVCGMVSGVGMHGARVCGIGGVPLTRALALITRLLALLTRALALLTRALDLLTSSGPIDKLWLC